jgi:2-aminoadipate transaminase
MVASPSSSQSPSLVAEARLSEYGQQCVQPSPVSHLMQQFSRGFRVGVDVNLGVGYVNEATIPAQQIADAFAYVTSHPEQYPHAFNYGESKGSERLVGALGRYFARHRIGDYTDELLSAREFAIGANGATSLLFALSQIMPRGIVLTTDPQYYIYSDTLRRLGFTLRTVPEDDDGLDIDALETELERCGDELSFVYVVTVGNPSAAILSNPRRERLVRAVTRLSRRLGRKVPLVLDAAYEWLVYADPATSGEILLGGAHWDELGLVYELGTLSKVLAPSLRIGFVLGPPGELMNALVQCTNDMGFSAPLINQEVCAHLLDTVVDDHVRTVREGYRVKSQLVKQALDSELGPWLEHTVGGKAGFYYYLTFKGIDTHAGSPFYQYCSRTTPSLSATGLSATALNATAPNATAPNATAPNDEARVVYLPGNLCVDPSSVSAPKSQRQLRLSFGFSEPEELTHGVQLMGEAARYAKDVQERLSETVLAKPDLLTFLQHALRSYAQFEGRSLVEANSDETLVQAMVRAPFVLVAHDAQAEPVFRFGNALALQLWEVTWSEFTSMPSTKSAEPMHRDERERFLKEVQTQGIARGYSGIRVSKSGRRFRIEDVSCWNVFDDGGVRLGQAACYARWTFLD